MPVVRGADFLNDALVALVLQVDPSVLSRTAGISVADARTIISNQSAGDVRRLFEAEPARAWQAILADPRMVSIADELVAEVGLRSAAASRQVVARRIALALTKTDFLPGSNPTTTVQGLHVAAQQFAHRFNASILQERHVKEAARAVDGLIAGYRRELEGFLADMDRAFAGAKTEAARKAVLKKIESRTGVLQARLRGLRSTTDSFADSFAGQLGEQQIASFRDGVDAAIDRVWDLHNLPGNRIAQEKIQISRRRTRRRKNAVKESFFRTNADALRVGLSNSPILAGRVGDQALAGIRETVLRTSILRGANSRYAAAEIRKEWGKALEGTRLSAANRAKFIARTETARIQAEADLKSQARLGVRMVDVLYSSGAFPCDVCPPIASGSPYPIDRVPEGGIPFHPNCRCSYAPSTRDQVTTASPLWNRGENRAADSVVVARVDGRDHVLMIRRTDGQLALPGGFVDGNEAGIAAARRTARRELVEETGLKFRGVKARHVGLFDDPARDPRASSERFVSSRGFLMDMGNLKKLPRVAGADDARAAKWFPLEEAVQAGKFADHGDVLRAALELRTQEAVRKLRGLPSLVEAVEAVEAEAATAAPSALEALAAERSAIAEGMRAKAKGLVDSLDPDHFAREIANRIVKGSTNLGDASALDYVFPGRMSEARAAATAILGDAEALYANRVAQLSAATDVERSAILNEIAESLVPKKLTNLPSGEPLEAVRSRIVADVKKSLASMPDDLVARIEANAVRVDWLERRGYWDWPRATVNAGSIGRVDTIDHEFGHALDSMLATKDARGFLETSNGAAWKHHASWLSPKRAGEIERAGVKLQNAFDAVVEAAGRKKGSLGSDGAYWLGDWVAPYDARIYSSSGGGRGIEFISQNSQRYLATKRVQERAFRLATTKGYDASKARAVAAEVGNQRVLAVENVEAVAKSLGVGKKEAGLFLDDLSISFAERNQLGDWARAKKLYGKDVDEAMRLIWGDPRY